MSSHDRPSLAIVGAGVSGLAAAWALRDSDWQVTVFEKSRGVSGRAASRTRHGARFDHGANYFKTDTPELEQLVLRELPTEGLVDIAGDIWVFDRDGRIEPGDPGQNAEPKWNYRDGISTLGKRLTAAAGVTAKREIRIAEINDAGGGRWELISEKGQPLGEFDAVLFTPPPAQVADLLRESEFDSDTRDELVALLGEGKFYRQFTLVFGFARVVEAPGECYALLNHDRDHRLAWLSFEAAKAGRVPAGESVLIAQMSPEWSAANFDAPDEALREAGLDAVRALLGEPDLQPSWFDKQRWRYAHPKVALDVDEIEGAAPEGWFFAGDAFVGKGRVGGSISTGLRAAERILGS